MRNLSYSNRMAYDHRPGRGFLIACGVVLIVCWGFVGTVDYYTVREAECAAMRKPRMIYDPQEDVCIPDPRFTYTPKESSNAKTPRSR